MITESHDKMSGVTRLEVGTVRPDICRRNIEDSGLVVNKELNEGVVRYGIMFSGVAIDVVSTETRTILFSLNRYALAEFLKVVEGSERFGTTWMYDDSKRSDYAYGR